MMYKNPVHAFKRWAGVGGMTVFNTSVSSTGTGTLSITNAANTLTLTNGTLGALAGDKDYYSVSVAWTLQDLPAVSEFSNLFDRYKIVGVGVRIMPLGVIATQGTPGAQLNMTGPNLFLHAVTDYDDAAAFNAGTAGLDAMRQYESYKVMNLLNQRPFRRFVRPRIASAVYSGAFTSYANMRNLWIDMNSQTVQYYGLKLQFEILNRSAGVYNCDLKWETVYYLKMKDIR